MVNIKLAVDTPAIKGLEKIQKIDILEDNTIIILYSITDEYMKEYDLYNKNRILKINPTKSEEWQMVMDYANVMEV